MGNGQNRTRRGGARTRHGPHRGGASNGDRRSATHVMPPALVSGADERAGAGTDAQLAAAQEAENAEERAEAQAGELRGAPRSATPEPAPGVAVASASEPLMTGKPADEQPLADGQAPLMGESAPARADAEAVASSATDVTPTSQPLDQQAESVEAAPEVERPAPRGRFERFYAPGQGARTERNGHGGAASNGATGTNGAHGGNVAARRPLRESPAAHEPLPPPAPLALLTPSAAQAPEDDEADAPASGPHEDVRGAVGGLIDALHDLFTQDRAVASQGGNSRCGVCYLHFPLGELVYREAEGFYVCQTCERALGAARISMVRRQQRQ